MEWLLIVVVMGKRLKQQNTVEALGGNRNALKNEGRFFVFSWDRRNASSKSVVVQRHTINDEQAAKQPCTCRLRCWMASSPLNWLKARSHTVRRRTSTWRHSCATTDDVVVRQITCTGMLMICKYSSEMAEDAIADVVMAASTFFLDFRRRGAGRTTSASHTSASIDVTKYASKSEKNTWNFQLSNT